MCVDAPLGKYVPSSGSRYATDASAGYYVPTTGQSTQTACLAGTYNPNTGSTSSLLVEMLMQDTMLIPPWDQDNHLKLLA